MKTSYLGAHRRQAIHYLLAIASIAAVALLFAHLANSQTYHLVSFVLLLVVSILSTFMGIGPVLLAAAGSALIWNFFFIPPHHTFHIAKTEDILIFSLFFIIALVNGVLTTQVRRQEKISREREKKTNDLLHLTRELSKVSGLGHVVQVATSEIEKQFLTKPLFILQDGHNKLHPDRKQEAFQRLTPVDWDIAEWVFTRDKSSGAMVSEAYLTNYTFYPLPGNKMRPGVMAVSFSKPLSQEQESYWDAFLTQISNALEREFLAELAQRAKLLDESDRLYKTLFNSISHELRIPVATIMGATDTILHSKNNEKIRTELYTEIFTASQRLNRLIENLLNISRIESGHISLRVDWYDINDLINEVTDSLNDELKPFTVQIAIAEDMPPVKIDFGLLQHALYNLLFNATQYAPGASVIKLSASYRQGCLFIEISDQGPGFPDDKTSEVFTKFYRGEGSKPGGLGLGLSIAKGFVEAHGGSIEAENNENGGAQVIIKIPSEIPDMNALDGTL